MLWLLDWFSLFLTLSLEIEMAYTLLKMVALFGLAVAAGLLAFVVIMVLHDAFFGD